MGFIGKAVGKIFRPVTKIVGSILGFGGQGKSNPVQIPQPTVTAQQLLPQTEAVTPEAPELGTNKKRKKVSRKSLMIERTGSNSGGGSGLNV